MIIYILCAVLAVLAAAMFVIYFINDKAQREEIKRLKEKVDYYIGYQPPQYNNGYKPTITPKPAPPKGSTPSPKSISIDTVKGMNAMCNIDKQRKQAVKEFAEKLKAKAVQEAEAEDYVCDIVDRLLKEYEK